MNSKSIGSGCLYVVATPIGNLSDITERAVQTLRAVDAIAAEDTRHTANLLRHLGISKPLFAIHEHNESATANSVVARLVAGENIALVSDAGTPLISDPGFGVVRAAIAAQVRVVPIPGVCAAIAALSASGLPTDRFVFEGFLPPKSKARRERLVLLASESRTLILYEAPHRLVECLGDIAHIYGARQVVIAREITKQFESFYYGTADQLFAQAQADSDMSRGELVLLIQGSETPPADATSPDAERVLRTLLEELPPAQAAKLAAKLTNAKRNELYELAVRIGGRRGSGADA